MLYDLLTYVFATIRRLAKIFPLGIHIVLAIVVIKEIIEISRKINDPCLHET